ncbi:MAG: PD40 domain-containing protein [Bryobacterales bacterium]|nr:PD40 domain-containing protein [Bryobacterales bacterium]
MTDQEWAEVWRIYSEARELPASARSDFLDRCGGSAEIRAEVQAMLECEDGTAPDPPAPGRQYGRYTLAERLGAGGMGEVFSARDAELGRMVAVKFVGAKARMLPSAIDRLIREAQAASALNHPSLVTVHDVLRFEGGAALVTELIHGQSLRVFCGVARPVSQVALWGAQIARALAAAHAESIVHSDIKPENIMLRSDGYVKILDFGLAQHQDLVDGLASLPLGTIGYMSPEQTRGAKLTGASDVFSLGVTLLELACGKHPFLEDEAARTTRAINHKPVEFAPPPVPGGTQFARLIQAMLAKQPESRPSAIEVAGRLERIAALGHRTSWKWWGGGAAAAVLAATAWIQWGTPSVPSLQLSTPVAITRYNGIEQQPSLSPDGSHVLFIWSGSEGLQDDVYMRPVAATDDPPQRITNDTNREYSPVWSHDGKSIAWQRRALDGSDTEIWVAAVENFHAGPARLIGKVLDHEGFYGLAWWPDSGSLVTRDRSGAGFPLVRVSLADGSKTPLTGGADVTDARPYLSPDRSRFLFRRTRRDLSQACWIEIAAPAQPAHCVDTAASVKALAWAPDSRSILLGDTSGLWLLQTPERGTPKPQRLMEGDFMGISPDGAARRYVFNRTITDSNIWRMDLASQKVTQWIASSGEDSEPQFSSDGSLILFRSNRSGSHELYVCGVNGSQVRKLTSLGGHLGSARWSPDGRWIAFDGEQQSPGTEGRTRFDNVYVMPAAGGAPRRLTDDTADAIVPGWSADSRWIYFTRGASRQAWKVHIDGGEPVKVSDSELWDAEESADGKWVYHERPLTEKGIWRRAVSGGFGTRIAGTEDLAYRTWSVSGNDLYFLRSGPGASFVQLSLEKGGPPRVVGPGPKRLLRGPRTMAVSPDGKTILYTSEDLSVGDVFLMEVRSPAP